MEIFIGIAVAVVVVIVALLAYIISRPTDFSIERSSQINAPAGIVFSIINDLKKWEQWSPYDKRDPAMKKTFEGPTAGPGAIYAWSGNNQVGEGRMTLVESKPGELVAMRLEFSRPFKCDNQVFFKIAPSEIGSLVTWRMEGKNNFMAKAFSLLMNMDKMVGKDFEQGLANLNKIARAEANKTREFDVQNLNL